VMQHNCLEIAMNDGRQNAALKLSAQGETHERASYG